MMKMVDRPWPVIFARSERADVYKTVGSTEVKSRRRGDGPQIPFVENGPKEYKTGRGIKGEISPAGARVSAA